MISVVDTSAGVWPITVAGWVALFASLAGLAAIITGGGRLLQRIADQTERQEVSTKKLEQIEGRIAELLDRFIIVEHTLWGPKGDNGISSQMRILIKTVNAILDRNRVIDAMEVRRRGAETAGHDDRIERRRREDRILSGEEDAT